MQRKLRRAARLLAAAVGLGGLATPALAQSYLAPWSPKPGAAQVTPTLASGMPVAPADLKPSVARWAEINVSLALLADEMTNPGILTPRVQGHQLELSGTVSCETARQRALQLARMHGTLPVRDSLKIQQGLAVQPVSQVSGTLTTIAVSLLHERFRERGKGLEVFSPGQGKLVVRGPVDSFEEKLLVSQTLRRVPGCRCVLNETTVTVVAQQGGFWQKVSPDGQLTVAASQPQSDVVAAGNPAEKKLATATVKQDRAQQPIQPTRYDPTSPSGTVVQAGAPQAPNNDPYRLVPVPTDGGYVQPQTTPAPAPQPQKRPFGGLFGRLFGSKEEVSQPTSTYTYPNNQVTYPPAPAGNTGTVQHIATTSGPADKPYVANGVVHFQGQPGTPDPRKIAVNAPDLKRRVLAVTAGKAREVDVVTERDGKVVIKLTVSTAALEKELQLKILQFPEMKSPNVRLEIGILAP